MSKTGLICGFILGVGLSAWAKFQTGSCDPRYKDYAITVTQATKDGVGVTLPSPTLDLYMRGTGESKVRGRFFDPDRADLMLSRDLRK